MKKTKIEVRNAPPKGRGVFAKEKITKGRIVELAPIILFSRSDHDQIKKTKLNDYIFDAGRGRAAVALGTASLYNHDENPNADYELDLKKLLIRITAVRTIMRNEEITIDYGYTPSASS